MRTDRSRTCSRQRRSFFPAVFGVVLVLLTAIVSQAADPPRMKRAEAFLGIHFDFHAGKDCDRVGARTTPEMVQTVIDKVKPDYLQIDCKGHPGYSSYPTKVGNPAPGFVGDPLRIWREVTRQRGSPLCIGLKASHPDFQVISNWAFSDHMPEPVSANVAGLSGDFSPDDSVNSARFAGRCLENQGVPWDLMSWSFSRKTRKQKPAVQLMQEAAVVLAMGGGYQAYFKQDRDGAVRDLAEMDVMARVAQFCRERQAYCHRSVSVPQIALLYSTAGHYRGSSRLFHWAGSNGVTVLRKALTQILQNQYGVQILSEHQLTGKMSQWPVIIVPGWEYLEPEFRDQLAAYAKTGGSLLLIGPCPAKLFETELRTKDAWSIVAVDSVDGTFPSVLKRAFPAPMVEVRGAKDVDVSPRMLNGRLSIHLVNTSGPHANAPDQGITAVEPVGPLTVSIRLQQAPQAITMHPEGKPPEITWADGQATVAVPRLDLYSILTVDR